MRSSQRSILIVRVLLLIALFAAAMSGCTSPSTSTPSQRTAPDLTGMNEADARAAIADAGLVVAFVKEEPSDEGDVGTVCRQAPSAGSDLDAGAEIGIFLTAEKPDVTVPELVGSAMA